MEEAIRSVNGLLQRGMDWGDIERIIEMERGRGNVVAEIILNVRFEEAKLVVGLREMGEGDEEEEYEEGDETDEEEEGNQGEGSGELVQVEIDLKLSGWANAREYFDKKKVAAEKVSPPASHIPNVRYGFGP